MAVNVVIQGRAVDFDIPAPDEIVTYPQGDDFEVVYDEKGYNPYVLVLREGKRIAYIPRPLRVEIVQEVA